MAPDRIKIDETFHGSGNHDRLLYEGLGAIVDYHFAPCR
jgi:hypothetical protein